MSKSEQIKINYEKCSLTIGEWIRSIVEVVIITGLVNYLCYRINWLFFSGIPFGYWYIRWKRRNKNERRRQNLEYQFYDVLQSLHTAVRAGYSMEQAILECRKEMQQIYGKKNDFVNELLFMERQMRLGVPVEQLFMDFGQRSGVEDIRYFGEIFMIAKRSGGNLAQIIEKLAKVLGEKSRVRKEIGVATAGKRLEQTIMSVVPGGIVFYMQITSEGFLDVLYHSTFGVLIMSLCLAIYIFSFWMGRNIIRISI